jgi:peptidoglycan/LPS O-acetylase OafA/YrhL
MRAAQQDIKTIQALRAAACLLVVAFHALDGRWANGAVGVDLFFVISGLVMGLSSRSLATRPDGWRIFTIRRLRRLIPLYWSLTGLKLAIGLALPATLAATRPGAWNIFASFLFIPSRDGAGLVRPVLGVGWTLQFEMLFYALYALALAWRKNTLGVLLPILLPLAIAGFWRANDWPAPLALANGMVLEFCMGLVLAALLARLKQMPPLGGWLLAAAGLALLTNLPSCGNWRFVCWGLPAACIVAGALVLEAPVGRRLPPFVLTLGEASYAIYLVHPFLVPSIVHASAAWLGHGAASTVCAIIASLIVASAAGWLLDHLFDRKIQAWLRRPKLVRSSAPLAPPQLVEL